MAVGSVGRKRRSAAPVVVILIGAALVILGGWITMQDGHNRFSIPMLGVGITLCVVWLVLGK